MYYNDASEPLLIDYLRSNSYIGLESFMTLRSHQNAIERMRYFDIVNEAASNANGRAAMIQKLYESILKHKNFDTTIIAKSKGVFTKFEYYNTIMDSVDTLNTLCDTKNPTVLQINDIIEILQTYRSDFEYGYKADVDFIIMYYEMLVVSLFQLIDFGICAYVETIKPESLSKKTAAKAKTKYASIINNMINTFKKGNWGKLVDTAKKSGSKIARENLERYEDGMDVGMEFGISTAIATVQAAVTSIGTIFTAGQTAGAIAVVGSTVGFLCAAVTIGFIAFVLAWAALHAIRLIVCWFYSVRFTFSDYLNRQAELLKYNTSADDPHKDKKEKKIARLQAAADFIAVKTKKIAEDAEVEEEKDDKDNFSTSAIKSSTQDMADAVIDF